MIDSFSVASFILAGSVALLVLAGFVLVWLSKYLQLDLGDASKTSLILMPLIVFLLLSNKVSEFEVLGWKTKFRDVVKERVDTARASELAISSAEANKPNFYQEAFWLACRPYYVLTDKTAKRQDDKDKLNQQATIEIAIAIRS